MTNHQTDTPTAGTPTVPIPALADHVAAQFADRARTLAAAGWADFDATFIPPPAPRTIGVNY